MSFLFFVLLFVHTDIFIYKNGRFISLGDLSFENIIKSYYCDLKIRTWHTIFLRHYEIHYFSVLFILSKIYTENVTQKTVVTIV